MTPTTRQIILVSGAPGVGKTTIAQPLAAMLGFALLSKDTIKEALFDALGGTAGDLAFSRKIGGAAMETLWALAAHCPHVVLEANFRPKSAYERAKIAALDGQIVEVHCWCPPEEVARRFAQRAATTRHHPAHVLKELTPDMLAEYDRPVGIGSVLAVDTSAPVDIEALARRVRMAFTAT
jgi:predicted kinase